MLKRKNYLTSFMRVVNIYFSYQYHLVSIPTYQITNINTLIHSLLQSFQTVVDTRISWVVHVFYSNYRCESSFI